MSMIILRGCFRSSDRQQGEGDGEQFEEESRRGAAAQDERGSAKPQRSSLCCDPNASLSMCFRRWSEAGARGCSPVLPARHRRRWQRRRQSCGRRAEGAATGGSATADAHPATRGGDAAMRISVQRRMMVMTTAAARLLFISGEEHQGRQQQQQRPTTAARRERGRRRGRKIIIISSSSINSCCALLCPPPSVRCCCCCSAAASAHLPAGCWRRSSSSCCYCGYACAHPTFGSWNALVNAFTAAWVPKRGTYRNPIGLSSAMLVPRTTHAWTCATGRGGERTNRAGAKGGGNRSQACAPPAPC